MRRHRIHHPSRTSPRSVLTATGRGVIPAAPASIGDRVGLLRRLEIPTWLALGFCYAGWIALTLHWRALPLWVLGPAGACLTCLYAHLCHEVIHGHPTRYRRLNALLIWPPLSVYLPFPLFRDSHLRHHGVRHLTCPLRDPESYYMTPAAWAGSGALWRWLMIVNQTFAGRMAIGPALMLAGVWRDELRRLARGDRRHLGAWLSHLAGVGVVLGWLVLVCGMPLWLFFVAILYPGLSLMLMRSYVEHRPGADHDRRCAIVEGGPFFGFLFLFNNLHVVHHRHPGVPWFDLPALYRRQRAHWLARNGGFFYAGYGEVARRYLLTPRDHPRHPGPPPSGA